jgi:hypothetical protein
MDLNFERCLDEDESWMREVLHMGVVFNFVSGCVNGKI